MPDRDPHQSGSFWTFGCKFDPALAHRLDRIERAIDALSSKIDKLSGIDPAVLAALTADIRKHTQALQDAAEQDKR